MGGNFANWGLMFSVFDCTFLYLRQKVSTACPHRHRLVKLCLC